MSVQYNRDNISDGIYFNSIIDKKFKSNCINIRFITKLDKSTASANAIIPNLLITSNSTYKTRTELTKKLSSLYGSSISTICNKFSDNQVFGISASCICDEYALEKEELTLELTNILLDCIFNPQLENDGFKEKDFNIRKQEMIDNIDAQINDKRTYAISRANLSIYENEPSALPSYGERENALNLNPQDTYLAYKKLLETSQIEITFSGGGNLEASKEKIKQAFLSINRNYMPNFYQNFSPVKSNVANITENVDVNQCKMVMAFKIESNNYYINRLMTTMLGGTAFSKLFVNVREKLSLCYYCAAGYVEGKGTVIIDSGVEKENIQKAREEIINQINALAKGNFTDDEMKNAVLSLASSYKSSYDSVRDLSSWYLMQSLRNTDYTPEQAIEILNKITREDIIKVASECKLDTVYVMENSEEGENE